MTLHLGRSNDNCSNPGSVNSWCLICIDSQSSGSYFARQSHLSGGQARMTVCPGVWNPGCLSFAGHRPGLAEDAGAVAYPRVDLGDSEVCILILTIFILVCIVFLLPGYIL